MDTPVTAVLTAKQTAALEQFQKNVQDIAKPDWDRIYYLRWLRARNYDLKKSERMLRDNVEWRKKMQADTILQWKIPPVLTKYYPGGYHGLDKDGYPLWIDCLGTVDLRGMMSCTTKKDILRFKVYWMEHLYKNMLPELTKQFGRRIDQCCLIFDMDGIGMKHLWKPALDVFIELLKIFEANYPETLRTCYVVNAPAIFPVLYNVAKPFLHEITRKKIKVCGPPSVFPALYTAIQPFLADDTKSKIQVIGSNWKEVLLKNIEPDQLPVNYGGTATDPDGDPCCKSKVCRGGTIPQELYASNVTENIDMSNFTTTTIARSGSLVLDYEVTEPKSLIRWNFWTEDKDVGFGIYLRTSSSNQKISEMESIVPLERVNSHMIPEDGSIEIEKPGSYVAYFDNTYSWMNAKKISYLVDVFKPDDLEEFESTKL